MKLPLLLHKVFPLGTLLLAIPLLSPALTEAGTYSQNFNSAALGTIPAVGGLGDGSVIASSGLNHKIVIWAQNNKALQLMTAIGGNSSSYRIPLLDVGQEIQSFDATFNMGTYRSSATAVPGAGWSLNFGAIPASGNGGGEGGFVMTNGIVVACDIFNNGGTDYPSIEVFCNGTSVGNLTSETYTGGTFKLTNPATGTTTAAIAYNATASTLQTAMRLVSGWGAVVVTGNAGGPWIVDHGAVGTYAAPTSLPATLLPAGSSLTVTTLWAGAAATNAKWTFPANLTDSPVMDEGTFTLTNPTSGGTTGPIAYNATIATVQAAMRLVTGWEVVVVGGSTSGPWTVDHGVAGAYASPTSDTANLVPANSAVTVAVTATGTISVNAKWSLTPRPYRPRAVSVHWDYDGLDVSYGATTAFTNLPTPGFIPTSGNAFAFSTRTESSNTMNLYIDDVSLSTTPLQLLETGGPVITEFVADNSSSLEDEDVDSPDWIEIYNGQNASVNLAGYRLTNAVGNNSMWTFPSFTMDPYTYRIVYASGKNRTVATGQLHTNFTLQKEAGYLALVKPDGVTLASAFNYGPQYTDVSYGEKGSSHTLGYLEIPTPKAKTPYSANQAPGGPSEDVVWSRVGGLIPAIVENGSPNGVAAPATIVRITAPLAPDSVIRYTTDNTEPTSASPVYNPASPPAAFDVTNTVNLRARIFTLNRLPSPVTSRTFVLMDRTLTNYNSSTKPFSSNLPIIVLESFGVPVDNFIDASNRPYRFTYAVSLDKDALSGTASINQATVDFQGRGGTHVRGSSSAGFPQHQYSWELWDNKNQDKDAGVLGMPAESDWVLYAPYDDKVLSRNHLIYSRMRALMGSDGFAVRTRFCEVFFNQEAGQPVSLGDYRGVYVLMEKIKINNSRVDVQKLNELTTDPTAITGGYIVKHDRVNTGDTTLNTSGGVTIGSVDPDAWNSAQSGYLQTYFNDFETALNGANFGDPVNGYQKYIDRDSFIYNQWFVEIAKQIDGYRLSQYFWKDRGGKLINGPLWDYNLALGNADYLQGWLPAGWYYPQLGGADYAWYPRLHQHTSGVSPYELRHWDLYWGLRRGLFATSTIMAEIDAEAAELLRGSTTSVINSMAALDPDLENPAMRHYRKWPVLGTYLWPNAPGWDLRTKFNSNGDPVTGEVDVMKDWLTKRLNWIDDQYGPEVTATYSQPANSMEITVTATAHGKSVGSPVAIEFTSGGVPYGPFTVVTVPNANTFTVTGYDTNVSLRSGSCKFLGPVIYRPPNFSGYGGNVAANFPLTITAYTGTPPLGESYATGSLYYTVNGTDPRGSNGMPAGTLYTGALILTNTQTVQARLYDSVSGYWSPATTSTFIVDSVPASAANLVISEIHYRPNAPTAAESGAGYSSANMFEYVELLNVSGQNVDLTNCKFTLGITYDFATANPVDLSLAPGQRIVLAGNKNAFLFRYGSNPAVKIVGEFTGNLSNSGERLILLAANGTPIADFTYGIAEPWPVAANGGGYSLVLNNPTGNPTYGTGTSWRSSPQVGGSPGLTNTSTFSGSPSGDTDQDGLKDYAEYAMGSSWSAASSRAETTCALIADPPFAPLGTYMQFSFPRNLWADGVIYTAQQSTSLTGWSSTGLVYMETVNNGNGTATVKYRTTATISGSGPRLYFRLYVAPP